MQFGPIMDPIGLKNDVLVVVVIRHILQLRVLMPISQPVV